MLAVTRSSIAIVVQVAGRDGVGLLTDRIFRGRPKLPPPVPRQHADGIVLQIGHGDVGIAVMIEVGNGNAVRHVAVTIARNVRSDKAEAAVGLALAEYC